MAAREVHVGDGVAWVRAHPFATHEAVITSLPDVSEVGMSLADWRTWFVDAVATICAAVTDDAVAIFYQTDIKVDGRWIDKGHLVHLGADRGLAHLLWHKIVCRAPAGATTFGRPAYAHLLCVSRSLRCDPGRSSADVLPQMGHMPWARAMGTAACRVAVRFAERQAGARTIVDPFCGLGTALAVANAHGLDAIGVELSAKRARRARELVLAPE